MSTTEIETKIKALDAEIGLLKTKVNKLEKKNTSVQPWWDKISGTFADDKAYDEAMRLGREYRLAQREDYDKDEE
ncbi:MAG: hypothetical protein ACRD6X_22460 [Pyrinomonadaceae bacterium]